jgi:hypothetical protein
MIMGRRAIGLPVAAGAAGGEQTAEEVAVGFDDGEDDDGDDSAGVRFPQPLSQPPAIKDGRKTHTT